MKYTIDMSPHNMIYRPSFMKIGLGFQVILTVLPQQSKRLQCW
jgi:hypothetical protein